MKKINGTSSNLTGLAEKTTLMFVSLYKNLYWYPKALFGVRAKNSSLQGMKRQAHGLVGNARYHALVEEQEIQIDTEIHTNNL